MTISMSLDPTINDPSINARVSRRFSTSPQRVFDAWLDSRTAGKWLFATASGRIVCAEIDARAGGWFYIAERRHGENVEHIGEYLEIVRPHRLVFTLSVEKYSLDFERVTVVFDVRGTGCELTVTHKTKPELARQVSDGWIRMLEGLAAVLGESSRGAPPREIATPSRGYERIAEHLCAAGTDEPTGSSWRSCVTSSKSKA